MSWIDGDELDLLRQQRATALAALDIVTRALYQAQEMLAQAGILLPVDHEQEVKRQRDIEMMHIANHPDIDNRVRMARESRERWEREDAEAFVDAAARETFRRVEQQEHECSPAECGMRPEYDFTDAVQGPAGASREVGWARGQVRLTEDPCEHCGRVPQKIVGDYVSDLMVRGRVITLRGVTMCHCACGDEAEIIATGPLLDAIQASPDREQTWARVNGKWEREKGQ